MCKNTPFPPLPQNSCRTLLFVLIGYIFKFFDEDKIFTNNSPTLLPIFFICFVLLLAGDSRIMLTFVNHGGPVELPSLNE